MSKLKCSIIKFAYWKIVLRYDQTKIKAQETFKFIYDPFRNWIAIDQIEWFFLTFKNK